MQFTMRPIFALTILIGLVACQYQYPAYNKFRPSPIDSTSGSQYNQYNQYNPNNDIYNNNLKTPNYPTSSPSSSSSYQDYSSYFPARPQYDNNYPYPGSYPGPSYPGPSYPGPYPAPYPGPSYQRPVNPPPPSKPLFTPAQMPFPAESPGQLANYNKALQAEAAEAQKTAQSQFFTTGLFAPDDFAKSYVDVKFGGPSNLQYHYNI